MQNSKYKMQNTKFQLQNANCKMQNTQCLCSLIRDLDKSRFPTSDHDVLDHAEQVEGLDGMSRGLLSLSQAHAVPPVSHLEQGVHNWVHERVSLGDRDLEEFCPGEISRVTWKKKAMTANLSSGLLCTRCISIGKWRPFNVCSEP